MIVEAKDVSVRYMAGDVKDIGLKEFFIRKLKRDLHREEYWAVDNVSFELERGDFLGVIGTNGAGKSTLLKSVSGILPPQKGSITVDGRIVALLELGTGFDGDLNLRENIYMRGALLGYSQSFLDARADEILDFAELTPFQNRRFKQLSSGMRSRLAFSISCLVDPDVLILDEVLSVGDGGFRQKSEQKMMEIIRNGATTIFVSHSMTQIRRLCNKILWLDQGKQIAFARTSDEVMEICGKYERYLGDRAAGRTQTPNLGPLTDKDRKIRKNSTISYYSVMCNLFLQMLSEPQVKENFMSYFKDSGIDHIAVYGDNIVYKGITEWLREAGITVDYIIEDTVFPDKYEIPVYPRSLKKYPATGTVLVTDLYNAATIKKKLTRLTKIPNLSVKDLLDGTYGNAPESKPESQTEE
jgi:ABC-2 type transport system ATP-binding protein